MDDAGREALLKYILRPSVAQERVTRGPDGLVRITLKKAFADGTVAVDMDPLSWLTRLAASVPPPKFSPFGDHEARHTVRYSEVLASASKLRSRIAPKPASTPAVSADSTDCVRRTIVISEHFPWDAAQRVDGTDAARAILGEVR